MAGDTLQRFIDAQAPVHAQACAELHSGRKRSHWMWFVFPQLRGLGHSEMAYRYGLDSLAEAQAYWRHPILGPRLATCVEEVLRHEGKTALDIFGTPDDLKFRSCLTLFHRAAPQADLFGRALKQFFGGGEDPKTVQLLQPG